MRAWGVAAAVVLLFGCSSDKAAQKHTATGGSGVETGDDSRYVDRDLGFEVVRPTGDWQMDVSTAPPEDGISTPVVMRNPDTGAQIVIQVAPAVATPVQFAERLSEGMRTQPGFITSDPEPLEMAEDAVGFRFAMGDRVFGRVAVRNGAPDRVLMMLATWPADAPENVNAGVEDVFRGVHPLN